MAGPVTGGNYTRKWRLNLCLPLKLKPPSFAHAAKRQSLWDGGVYRLSCAALLRGCFARDGAGSVRGEIVWQDYTSTWMALPDS